MFPSKTSAIVVLDSGGATETQEVQARFGSVEYAKQLAAGANRCRARARLAPPEVARSLNRLADGYRARAAAIMEPRSWAGVGAPARHKG